MRIALIDVDGHNFPSLPLMKLSAWHRNMRAVFETVPDFKDYKA